MTNHSLEPDVKGENMAELISLNEAEENGIERLRKPIWAQPEDYIKIDLLSSGKKGPWIHVYSPFNRECNGRDPVSVLFLEFNCDEQAYEPYNGPLPDSDEYKEKEAAFDDCLA